MGKMLAWIILFVVGCCADYQDSDGFLRVFLFLNNKNHSFFVKFVIHFYCSFFVDRVITPIKH